MTGNAIGSRAYGAAAIAIGLDGLAAGQAAPLVPFGSSLSLVAAGTALIFGSALSPIATRLAALIFAAWAIVLKIPLILADPADRPAWIALIGLLTLSVIASKLASGEAVADAHDAGRRTGGWRPRLAPLSRTGFSAAKG